MANEVTAVIPQTLRIISVSSQVHFLTSRTARISKW